MSDINNGSRRAIEYLVYGALPPHSTKVLWMDTSVPELPVLKIFWNGVWTPVNTDNNKTIELLVDTVYAQQETINQLENQIETTTEETKEVVEKLDEEKLSAFTLANAILSGGTKINLIHLHHVAIPGDHCPFTQNAPALRTGRDFEVEIGGEIHTRIEWVVEGGVFVYTESDTAGEPVYLEKDATETRWMLTISNPEAFRLSSAADIQSIIGDNSEATNSEILHTLWDTQQIIDQDVAKQGTNSAATLTAVQSLLQSLVNAHVINNTNLDGWNFVEQGNISNLGNAITKLTSYIKSVDDPTVTTLERPYLFRYCPFLESVNFPNLEQGSNQCYGMFDSCQMLTSINLPKLSYYGAERFCNNCLAIEEISLPEMVTMAGNFQFGDCRNLKKLYLPKLVFTTMNSWHNNCYNLIDFTIGNANLTSSFTINSWSPTEALRSDSTSLVDEGETFSSNLEKLLYNIREHIAANLPDRTGLSSLTATFTAAIKAAIQADTATSDAFTSKNWTIA